MVILVDTNIIIDFLKNREPYAENAKKIIFMCAQKKMSGYLAAHTIPNLFYILRKEFSQEERRTFIVSLCDIFMISGITKEKIVSAAQNSEFVDFEDCLQEECAFESMADYIVTRDVSDYRTSRIKAITPEELLKQHIDTP